MWGWVSGASRVYDVFTQPDDGDGDSTANLSYLSPLLQTVYHDGEIRKIMEKPTTGRYKTLLLAIHNVTMKLGLQQQKSTRKKRVESQGMILCF